MGIHRNPKIHLLPQRIQNNQVCDNLVEKVELRRLVDALRNRILMGITNSFAERYPNSLKQNSRHLFGLMQNYILQHSLSFLPMIKQKRQGNRRLKVPKNRQMSHYLPRKSLYPVCFLARSVGSRIRISDH